MNAFTEYLLEEFERWNAAFTIDNIHRERFLAYAKKVKGNPPPLNVVCLLLECASRDKYGIDNKSETGSLLNALLDCVTKAFGDSVPELLGLWVNETFPFCLQLSKDKMDGVCVIEDEGKSVYSPSNDSGKRNAKD